MGKLLKSDENSCLLPVTFFVRRSTRFAAVEGHATCSTCVESIRAGTAPTSSRATSQIPSEGLTATSVPAMSHSRGITQPSSSASSSSVGPADTSVGWEGVSVAPTVVPAGSQELCSVCSELLAGQSAGFGLQVLGRWYHMHCFVCAHCGERIDHTEGCAAIRGEPYPFHETCAQARLRSILHSHAAPCAGCGAPIDGQVLAVGDAKYHPSCFICARCDVPTR
jgi:hypothetical protein